MKAFILLICFSFGMLLTMPPGNKAQAANTHQITLVSDVGQVMPAYEYQVAIDFAARPLVVQDIGAASDVPIAVCTAEIVQKRPDFNSFYNLNYRTCLSAGNVPYPKKFLTKNTESINRFARDGLRYSE